VTLNKVIAGATQRWLSRFSCALAKFGEVGSTHPWEPFSIWKWPYPLKLHDENRQEFSRGLYDFAQILYRD